MRIRKRTVVSKQKDFSRSWAVYCKSGNISKTLQNISTLLLQTTDRKWCMAYRITWFPMTLSDFEGHAPIAGS